MTEKTFRQPSDHNMIKEMAARTSLFSSMAENEFSAIYGRCEEREYEKGVLIAHAYKKREGVFLVTSGLAEVYAAGSMQEREVLELAGPGEILGLASLSTMLRSSEEKVNTVEIQVLEPTLGLFIPYEVLREIWNFPHVQAFFLEKTIFRLQDVYHSLTEQLQQSNGLSSQRKVFKRVQDLMSAPLLSLSSSSTLQEGIEFMSRRKLSAVVLLDDAQLLGVVSIRETIDAIAANQPLSLPLASIANKRPYVISRSAYYYDALGAFQQQPDLRHLVVVNDEELPVGMLTLSDVLKQRHRFIQQTMKKIHQLTKESIRETAVQLQQLSHQLLEENESFRMIASIMTPLFDQLVIKVIHLAQKEIKQQYNLTAPCEFVFYQMGSAGRGEQLMMTDQDHFLVYKELTPESEQYFSLLGDQVVEWLEEAGFAPCDGNMMASNPVWRGSIESWQQRIHRFAVRSTPEHILHAFNFFAMRRISGSRTLHLVFLSIIEDELKRSGVLLTQMGRELRGSVIPVMDHRIRSLLLREGRRIQIKKQILFPFHHSLQIKGLLHQIIEGSASSKIEALAEKKKLTKDAAEELKESLDIVLMLYFKDKKQKGTGQINTEELTGREKALLSRALNVLREFQVNTLRELGV
ncbi:DUF294 nucleotidyltransferase-like domain-containing protein [Jeotgalibacillus sp. ET6]|uniref:DUF294 nucleotidyltransferase-like domain-containing protein n=1 Tax=Jeotgalibacillus sp. ET6 TaxID=3037260 RepID=UPI0024188ADB|nr:DUF294 nucleotidyltransferase-like domain-containing protein [Jeotgalibacillus sp. ET6]MDG5472765.1 DUF294 nucleotidyltransferase-like domain-containing protein [Jeotgalibacillus sp. ET6]